MGDAASAPARPRVTILLPSFRTRELTCLCLRLLRRHTDPALARVLVIDNDSGDESLDYLRGVAWIELLERRRPPGEQPHVSHARALDLGFERVETPYVLSLHTDSFVLRPDWLPWLLAPLEADPGLAGVGAWKQGERSGWRHRLKLIERGVERRLRPLLGLGAGRVEGLGENFFYLRSHCALYRTAPLRALGLSFALREGPAGKWLHRGLVEAGWRMKLLQEAELAPYLLHANRATQVLNPDLGIARRYVRRGNRRLLQVMRRLDAPRLLADSSLDR